MHLEIVNWEKYNPRTDRTPQWFRLNNDFIFDDKLFGLEPLEKLVWVYFLALCSRNRGKSFSLDFDYLEHHAKIKKTIISSAIQKLASKQIIKILESGNQLVPSGNQEEPNGGLRNVTVRNDTTACAELEKSPIHAPPNISDKISEELKSSWLKTYQDAAWINLELNKAQAWIHANRNRAPKKDFGRFLNNWLSRGWDQHRKTLKDEKVRRISAPAPDVAPHPGPMSDRTKELLGEWKRKQTGGTE